MKNTLHTEEHFCPCHFVLLVLKYPKIISNICSDGKFKQDISEVTMDDRWKEMASMMPL